MLSSDLVLPYLPVLQSAERGWNPDADPQSEAWSLSREFLSDCAAESMTLLDWFKQKEAILGVLIGTMRMRYSDSTAGSVELRYGLNVLAWKLDEKLFPNCYSAAGFLAASTAGARAHDLAVRDAFFFACDWGNPHPGKEIANVELISAGTEATPFLLALTAWPTQK